MSILQVLEPTPQRPSLKRSFLEDLDSEIQGSAPKRCRDWSPLCEWLSNISAPKPRAIAKISRSRSLPATTPPSLADISRSQSLRLEFDDNQDPPAIEDLIGTPTSLLTIDEIGDRQDKNRSRRDDDSFSQRTCKSSITKIKPISTNYRSVLEYNDVEIDPTGNKISKEIRSLLDTHILKKRTSPPLSHDVLKITGESMNEWGSSTENVVNSFISSPMFPIHRSGIGLGGNSPWPRAALPYNQDFGFPISTPTPDYHVGYDTGIKSGFSAQQAHVINHPQARPYTQPGTGNVLPFLTVELKSEATGGTLYHAENQAAGSGTYSLRAMEWLFDQANAPQQDRQTDTVTFSMTGTGRLVILSAHWHSPEDRMYYMSYVKGFIASEPEQVQACHNTVKNIVEWGLGKRHSKLGDILQQLFPLTQQWTEKRTVTAAELDDPGADDEGDEGMEAIDSVPRRVAKSRRSEREGTRRSPSTAQSFPSTQSLGDRCLIASKDTSVTQGVKSHTPKPSPRR